MKGAQRQEVWSPSKELMLASGISGACMTTNKRNGPICQVVDRVNLWRRSAGLSSSLVQ